MKKSQILAALALAAALGVVAPVAGVVTQSASAYDTEAGTATEGDVENAIAMVEANDNYKKVVALMDAYNAYVDGSKTGDNQKYADFSTTIADGVIFAAEKAGISGHREVTANKNGVASVADALAVIDAVEKDPNYQAYYNLNKAVESKDLGTLVAGIKAFNAYLASKDNTLTPAVKDLGINLSDNGPAAGVAGDYDRLKTELESKLGTELGGEKYDKVVPVTKAIEDAKNNIKMYNDGMEFLTNAIEAAGISEAGEPKFENANQPSALAKIIFDNNSWQGVNFNFGSFSNWVAVQNTLKAAKKAATEETSTDNYKQIEKIADALKTADSKYSKLDTTVVMAQLVNYTAPSTPADPEEPGADEGDKKDEDGDKADDKNGAPNTGVLTTAEGTAAASAGIMAAVATALTAAGVGVVAFRSARRKNA